MTQHQSTSLRPARKVLVLDDEESYCLLLANMISGLVNKVMTSNQAESVHLDEKKMARDRGIRLIGVLHKPFRLNDVCAVMELD